LLPTSGDYLFPVSANLGMNKINREVTQRLAYAVDRDASGHLLSRVTLTIANRRPTTDPGPYPTADYRDYLRVFVPAGSELVSADGFDDPAATLSECGRTAFGGFVAVSPRQERTLHLVYRLPSQLEQEPYTLVVQKQPGVAPFPVSVQLPGHSEAVPAVELGKAWTFTMTDGQPTDAPWSPNSIASSVSPACAVEDRPPVVLAPPQRITIPKLGVQAETVDLGIDPDGTLQAPDRGDVIGWYIQSARPGQVGNLVVSGHVDWAKQTAVFWRLHELGPGDRIEVTTANGGRYTYEVEWLREVSSQVDTDELNRLIGASPDRLMTLITCSGPFDARAHAYENRTVVRAHLIPDSGGST
jgi:LPXTG-site transpeptidase (sortase) family protein